MPRSQITAMPVDPRLKSLADVLARLEQDSDLDDARRQAYRGAVRTMCSALGRPAEALPITMPEIDRLLRDVPAPARGRSKKTIANTRSRLKAALLHVTNAPKLPPHGTPLRAEWATLYNAITDLRLRNGLSRLIRIASFRGVPPTAVDDAFLQDVLRGISEVNWGRDTMPFWRATVALWNEAAATIPHWPQTRLTPPPQSKRPRHLSLEELPASFRQDLEAYLAWASGVDPFAEDAPGTSLKPSTLRQRREQLRLGASTLASCIGDPNRVESLATLVIPANMRLILSRYLERAERGEPTAFIRGLAVTLLAVARHWVKVPSPQLDELKRFNRRLGSAPTGLTEKNQDLIRRFEDRELLVALLNLPETLREQLRTRRLSPARRLQKIQVALAIELLLAAPMRLQNLSMLELDRSLQWPSGRNGPVYIVLRRDETKNDLALEYPLEGHTKALLHEYLDRYRCYGNVKDSHWLFVRLDGTKVTDGALRDGITKAIARELGIAMTPHQFRHVAAAVALDAHPGPSAWSGTCSDTGTSRPPPTSMPGCVPAKPPASSTASSRTVARWEPAAANAMPKALRLPLSAWPAVDRSTWERATAPVDYFDDLAPAARWSPETRYRAQAAYGRWLAFLRDRFPEVLQRPPAERVDAARARVYVETLATRIKPMSIAAELGHLVLMLRVLAPRERWAWLRQWQYRYQKRAIAREKRDKMVHPVRLLELGLALMDGAVANERKGEQARQYRDGLLIAVLTTRPLRRRSLSELKIGTHLRQVGSRYVLSLEGVNTKSGQPVEFPLPERLTPYMTHYLEHHRLFFSHTAGEQALWLSAKGGALRSDAIYACICRRTKTAFGIAIHPHLFRDIAATTIAREAPEALSVARDLLTHANVETTLRHYAHAHTIEAAREFAAAVDRLRAHARTAKR